MEIRRAETGELAAIYIMPIIGCTIYLSPFHNCQVFCIGGTDQILSKDTNDKRMEIFALIAKTICKPRMIIDVENFYATKIENLFTKEQIIFKQPYESANGSDMIMYQIDVSHLY